MLQLLSALQTGRTWGGAELARRLDTSMRTLRRDVDRLRELGYPVEARPGPGGHYRLVAGTAMPPLLLDDDEAVAVAVGLRLVAESGESALRKLEQVLPARLRRKVAAVHATTETTARPTVSPGLLSLVGAAAQHHERLVFDYRSRGGTASSRRVEPYRQVLSRRRWYLLAWDLDKVEWRTFRLDRLADARTTGERFTPRELPAETAAAYLDAKLKEPHHRAVITFLAPAAEVADRLPDRDGTLEPLGEAHCRYTTWVDSFEWLAMITAISGLDFRVEEPAGFVDYCRVLRDRLDRAVT